MIRLAHDIAHDIGNEWVTGFNIRKSDGTPLPFLDQSQHDALLHGSTASICKKICYDSRFPEKSILEPGKTCVAFQLLEYPDNQRSSVNYESALYYDKCRFFASTATSPMVQPRVGRAAR